MNNNYFILKGCRENNLKNFDLEIPRNKFVTITGPSGSGKSSLAFDVLYKEGQRRYTECLNTFGQQYLEQFQAPDVDLIEGLSPTVAIRSKRNSTNPRSTVATSSGIYDLLRILFANFGELHDPETGQIIKSYPVSTVVKSIQDLPLKTKVQILSPITHTKDSSLDNIILKYEKLGFNRAVYQNEIYQLSELIKKETNLNDIYIIIDRVITKEDIHRRLTDSIELAYKVGNGILYLNINDKNQIFCEQNINPTTGQAYPKLTPRFFSFNRPEGACPACNGTGKKKEYLVDNIIFDPTLTIRDGALYLINENNSFIYDFTNEYLERKGIQNKSFNKLSEEDKIELFFGEKGQYNYNFKSKSKQYSLTKSSFPGVINWLNKNLKESDFKVETICSVCNGGRLNPIALSTYFDKKNIADIGKLNIEEAVSYFKKQQENTAKDNPINTIFNQINYKLELMNNIGLNYLSLDRNTSTLSGGENQRLNIASQLGAKLSGVLYILDEPTIGFHQSETFRLIESINKLVNNGNSVIVVEHDLDLIKAAEHIIELGPKSGYQGGEIISSTDIKSYLKSETITSKIINEYILKLKCDIRNSNQSIVINAVNLNNLNNINVSFPLNNLISISGPSGSGKSTLIHHVLANACRNYLSKKITPRDTTYNSILGLEHIKGLVEINSQPIGKTPSSIPATFLGIFKHIRDIFTLTNDSKVRGYNSKRFSFNIKGGRCDHCEGRGEIKIDMHFLADVWVKCNICNGTRYNLDTLSILYRGKSIADVLEMPVSEALLFFENHPKIKKPLELLASLDLSYIKLGQSTLQLSGGELQRLKIVKELSKKTIGHTLYILDEPTSGLHSNEIDYLIKALNNLVDQGNTVIVIEHNLDVITQSDHIIDIGPESGPRGGNITFSGKPEDLLNVAESKTAQVINAQKKGER